MYADASDGRPWNAAADAMAEAAASLGDHGRLFVRNLPFTVTEEELHDHFASMGAVAEVHVPMDAHTRRGKGFAYVRYASGEQIGRAHV